MLRYRDITECHDISISSWGYDMNPNHFIMMWLTAAVLSSLDCCLLFAVTVWMICFVLYSVLIILHCCGRWNCIRSKAVWNIRQIVHLIMVTIWCRFMTKETTCWKLNRHLVGLSVSNCIFKCICSNHAYDVLWCWILPKSARLFNVL